MPMLNQQATFLWERGPRGIASRYEGQGKMEQRKLVKNQAVLRLASFSLEHVIEAYHLCKWQLDFAGSNK